MMEKKDGGLKHRDLTQKIIGVFYEVYNELGHVFSSLFMKPRLRWLSFPVE